MSLWIAKLAEDIENTRKTVEEQISTSKTSSIEEPTEDTKKPYSNPLFDIPGEALDNAIFGPYYRSRLDTTDANTAALIDSGALNMPILKMLNIPKCILFASSTFTGALAVYSLVRSKSASVFVAASIISHETLRLSYNMYVEREYTSTISSQILLLKSQVLDEYNLSASQKTYGWARNGRGGN